MKSSAFATPVRVANLHIMPSSHTETGAATGISCSKWGRSIRECLEMLEARAIEKVKNMKKGRRTRWNKVEDVEEEDCRHEMYKP